VRRFSKSETDASDESRNNSCQMLGKYEESIENGKQCVALNPGFPPGYNNLAWAYVQLNRLTDAENTIREASEHKLAGEFQVMQYVIAFLRGDAAGMARVAAESERDPNVGDWIVHAEGCVLAFAGRLQEARMKSRQAADSVLQATHKREHAATYDAGMAVREAFFGNAREARQYAAAALDVARGRDVEYGAAFALGLVGDTAGSQALAKDLEKASEDTYVRFNYLPTLRALWAVKRGDSPAAIEALEIARPYELAVSGRDWLVRKLVSGLPARAGLSVSASRRRSCGPIPEDPQPPWRHRP
jgi:eukaryotic-like serine/threonine-protein kinase